MEQTPLPPLLSDEHRDASCPYQDTTASAEAWVWGFDHCRHLYEADRQRTREVVQRLVDALQRERLKYSDIVDMLNIDRAVERAKSQLQIEPTNK